MRRHIAEEKLCVTSEPLHLCSGDPNYQVAAFPRSQFNHTPKAHNNRHVLLVGREVGGDSNYQVAAFQCVGREVGVTLITRWLYFQGDNSTVHRKLTTSRNRHVLLVGGEVVGGVRRVLVDSAADAGVAAAAVLQP